MLRVEAIFADAWGVIRRHAALYLLLTLVCGVAPTLMVTALAGGPPGDMAQTPMAARIAAMALFVIGDAVLSGALAVAVFAYLDGRRAGLAESLAAVRARFAALLLAAAAIDAPMLALNFGSSLIAKDAATSLALYGVRFAIGTLLGAVFAGAAAAIVAEGLSARAGLARAAALTRGHRARTALFFAAFFLLKVLGPYLLVDLGLARLGEVAGGGAAIGGAVAVAGVVVWNLLACSLGVGMALIYAALSGYAPSGNSAHLDAGDMPLALRRG